MSIHSKPGPVNEKDGLFANSMAVLAARIGGGVAGFGVNVALARLLGVEGVGLFFLAMGVTGLAIVLGRAGMENAVLRFSAVAAAKGDWASVAALRRSARRLSLLVSTVVAFLLFVSAPTLAGAVFGESSLVLLLRITALGVPVAALAALDIELVRGVGRVRVAAILEAVPSHASSVLFVLPLTALAGLIGAAVGTVLAAVSVLTVLTLALRRLVPRPGERGAFDRRLLLRTGVPLLFIGLSGMLLNITDTLMLGALADAQAVGLYGVAAGTAAIATFVLAAVNGVVSPRFAAFHAAGRIQELATLARRATVLAAVFATPVLLVCALAPGPILSLFGSEFTNGRLILVLLAVGHGINVLTGPVGFILMMSGREKLLRKNVVVSGGVNISLNLLLVPELGAVGAATATAVSLALLNTMSLVQVRRHIGIWTLPFTRVSAHG